MKKYFYSVLAASMLFACSQEEIVDVTKGEGQKVTFKVEIPEVSQSRAIDAEGNEVGAGKYADKLLYAMYEEDKNDILITKFVEDDEDGTKDGKFHVTVPMAKDIKYDILFLAYNDAEPAFDIKTDARSNNLKAISLKSGLKANKESYDAFIGRLDSKGIDAATTTTVTLKRPFAQVNAATTSADLEAVKTLKTEVTTSKFVIYNAPNTLNVFTGDVSGKETITYNQYDILKEYGKTEYPKNEKFNNEYYYLAMAYVLADEKATYDADFSFFRADNKPVSSFSVKSMPIEANFRTNILGTLLTQQENYEITIDKEFGVPANEDIEPIQKVVVDNETDLVETVNGVQDGESIMIVIGGNITLGSTSSTYSRAEAANNITIPSNTIVKIDLNGHNISGTDNSTASFGLINLNPGSNLSIINSSATEGKITLTATQNREWNAYSSVISNQRATLTVGANVVVEHLGGTDMAYGIDNLTNTGAEHAKTTIEGATIKSTYRAIRQFLNSSAAGVNNELEVKSGTIEGENKSIWMQDANASANPGKLVVTENANLKGNVYLTVTAGSAEWPVEVSIAAAALKSGSEVLSTNVPKGYIVAEYDGVWSVINLTANDGSLEISNLATFKYFRDQVNAGVTYEGKTVKLVADIDLNNEEWTPIGSATQDHGFMGNFDGNGYTIKNLKITSITPDADGYVYAGLFGVTEGTDANNENYIKNLTIENVNIDLKGHIVAAAIAYPYYTTLENIKVKGNVTIKGGDYTSGVLAYTRRCVNAKNISIEGNNGSTIEGAQVVGGVISDIQMNGGLIANYSNFAASGLTIKATSMVGGISGIIATQTLNGATVKNVTIECGDDRIGIVSGALGGKSTITNVSHENIIGATLIIGDSYSDGSDVIVNGNVYDLALNWRLKDGNYEIASAKGLFWFANEVNVNKNAFNGKTVKLIADIDLDNAAWTPIGQTGATTFNGVFDGQNYTISNLNVDSDAQTGKHYSSGLFGWVESHTAGHGHLKNVKINGATIVGHHNCGALVGYITQETALVENCHITGANITCTKANDDADGDKAGALIGNATVATPVKNCTAANSTVSGGRDSGQVIGAGKEANVTGCSATNVTVTANGTGTGANVRNEVIGRLL